MHPDLLRGPDNIEIDIDIFDHRVVRYHQQSKIAV